MNPILLAWARRFACISVLLSAAIPTPATPAEPTAGQMQSRPLTSLLQLLPLVRHDKRQVCSFRVQAVVLAASPADGVLFLDDGSAAALIEMDLGQAPPACGDIVILEGTNCAVARGEFGLRLGKAPVVDVDGSHPPIESSGPIYLHMGLHPIRVAWFNDIQASTLEIRYEGPELPRQKIPGSALFRQELNPASGSTNFVQGLDYRCFEGQWERLPDFDKLTPSRTGVAGNFDHRHKSRNEKVGLEFRGFLNVTTEGLYKFYVKSDDGGQLFIAEDPPRLRVIGSAPLPDAHPIAIGEALSSEDEQFQWSQAEGELSFVGQSAGGSELELSSGGNQLRLKIINSRGERPPYLLHRRVRVAGVCQATSSADGQLLAGALALPDWKHVQVLDAAAEFSQAYPSSKIEEVLRVNLDQRKAIVRLRGNLRTSAPDAAVLLSDETGQMPVELLMPPPDSGPGPVEVLGTAERVGQQVILRQALCRPVVETLNQEGQLPVLTTAAQVQRLSREEAQRKYPVKIRGVVSFVSPNYASMVVQDSTRAIYVSYRPNGWTPDLPQVGEYWQIEGVSNPADFSPIVQARKAARLGLGRLPGPVHPTWDQLLNGSLDAQYVELEGVVTAVRGNRLTLLTQADKINVTLIGFRQEQSEGYKNARVRVRGCLFAEWDAATHRIRINQGIRIGNPRVSVEEPAPLNPFEAAHKSAPELLIFDAQASALQRVRVAGQIIHERDGECYLMDGTNGLRFRPAEASLFQPGDRVEVVGFPELGGPSPVLREAVGRKLGSGVLPAPIRLAPEDLIQEDRDSTLVSVEGLLLNVREVRTEQLLEMQSGLRTFVARVHPKDKALRSLEAGSRLELTGVYAGQGGNRAEGRDIKSFELLINAPSDIRLISRPPWWTLERLLIVIGFLLSVLGLALVWITLLRRQVDKRTAQLQHQIRQRERAEHARAIEEERARIARDLHDDLGSSLTEISMLSTSGPGLVIRPDEARQRLDRIAGKSRCVVHALDELVWAINPRHDTLASLAKYLASYTEEFLSSLNVRSRVQSPHSFPERTIPAETRHSLLLAVKEILNNAVRHGRATEILFRVTFLDDALQILIKDNGGGFNPRSEHHGNGLANLRERMRSLNGACELESSPGNGTTVSLSLSLATELVPA